MNLVTDPWIPVLNSAGTPELVSLEQALTEGERYRDLAVRPHERIALMRLLICIAQAALDGPEDFEVRESAFLRLSSASKDYLREHQPAFNLFDDKHPFLQVPAISVFRPSTPDADKDAAKISKKRRAAVEDADEGDGATGRVSKLDLSLATGAASSLFDHEGLNPDRSLSNGHVAISLLAFQCFSLTGIYGQVNWGNWTSPKRGNAHAPCVPKSMLHSFVRRSNLAATICSNLLTKEAVRRHFNQPVNASWGRPIWECMPTGHDDPAMVNATKTYLGRLVPLSRLILLREGSNSMLLGSAPPFPAFDGGTPATKKKKAVAPFPSEPSATVQQVGGDELRLLGAGGGTPWRELAALVTSRKQGQAGGALTLDNVPDTDSFDLWVGALVADKASVIDTVESVLHVPAKLRTENGRRVYEDEIRWAEGVGGNPSVPGGYGRLGRAVLEYRRAIDRGWDSRVKAQKTPDKMEKLKRELQGRATRHFWTAVETLRSRLLLQVEAFGTPAIEARQMAWRNAVLGAAREAYELACGKETPRQMRAYTIGYAVLFPTAKSAAPVTQPSQDVHEEEEA